ncbi:MAG: D-ribose pyranase [Tissierellales bacterium]|nr:D-ribose pyranase [Tissierellales bacterium]MBN2827719.1 D-ribose pyranase [Tissierellales bacterium]
MKKQGLLNSEISYVISKMGHYDQLVVCDAGLPISDEIQRIDLAISKNFPRFLDTLGHILKDLQLEKVIIASEIKEMNPQIYHELTILIGETKIEEVTHETFKDMTLNAKAVVRTGECTPYANIILVSGVIF